MTTEEEHGVQACENHLTTGTRQAAKLRSVNGSGHNPSVLLQLLPAVRREGAGAQLISEEKPIIRSAMPPLLTFKYRSNETPTGGSDSSTNSL